MSTDGRERFLLVSFNFTGPIDKTGLKKKFDLAIDWIHYIPSCWIIRTVNGPSVWYERLKPHLGPKDHMFICEIRINERQGWLPKWVWDWFQKL